MQLHYNTRPLPCASSSLYSEPFSSLRLCRIWLHPHSLYAAMFCSAVNILAISCFDISQRLWTFSRSFYHFLEAFAIFQSLLPFCRCSGCLHETLALSLMFWLSPRLSPSHRCSAHHIQPQLDTLHTSEESGTLFFFCTWQLINLTSSLSSVPFKPHDGDRCFSKKAFGGPWGELLFCQRWTKAF